jgi:hypothetical protein
VMMCSWAAARMRGLHHTIHSWKKIEKFIRNIISFISFWQNQILTEIAIIRINDFSELKINEVAIGEQYMV